MSKQGICGSCDEEDRVCRQCGMCAQCAVASIEEGEGFCMFCVGDQLAHMGMVNDSWAVEVDRQQAEIERLREALKEYDDPGNWKKYGEHDKYYDWWYGTGNGWEVAREALAAKTST